MRRCIICERIIWPWQRRGHRVAFDTLTLYWHTACIRKPKVWLEDHGYPMITLGERRNDKRR